MDSALDDVERAVKDTFGRFFASESGAEVVRAAEPLGFDRDLWNKALEMGALRMGLPAALEGDDADMVCLSLVAAELGRTVAPIPLIDSTVAARALARSESDEAFAALKSMLAGDEVIVYSPRPIANGTAPLVPSGAIADLIVAIEGDSLVLARVQPKSQSAPNNLGSMPLADCVIAGDRVLLADGVEASQANQRALTEAKALTASAMVGVAERSIDIALEYVKIRTAFGTLIGSFQTVSHGLADSVVDIDGARLLSFKAAWTAEHDAENAAAIASMAFIFASEVARRCSGHSLHFHGGIGYTMEHDIQLYYRRAKAWPLAYTSSEREYQHLADLLYGPSGQEA
ncbi:MAG: acyl-CoA dehydrogenase family protein [bacterium]|nr:acyl-CoA dehydrogenase family protein [bacterium]